MPHLFAYGTLMDPDVMRAVAACLPPHEPATLSDFHRKRVRDAAFPAILSHAGGRVEGLLYRDLPPAAWADLDAFEGGLYQRESVAVQTADGREVMADTYVLCPQYAALMSGEDWDFQLFIEERKQAFLEAF